jgi:hypothetical protein
MSVPDRIREVVESRAAPRSFDVVGVVDQLFRIAAEAGPIACTQVCNRALRFEVGDQPAFEVQLVLAKSRLRGMCARLATVASQQGGGDVSPYGGEAVFDFAPESGPARRWELRFQNTTDRQEFSLAPMEVPVPCP